MFSNKKKITILNKKWETILEKIEVKDLPRKDELIFLEKLEKYYSVINIIHHLGSTTKDWYFVIVDELTKQPEIKK